MTSFKTELFIFYCLILMARGKREKCLEKLRVLATEDIPGKEYFYLLMHSRCFKHLHLYDEAVVFFKAELDKMESGKAYLGKAGMRVHRRSLILENIAYFHSKRQEPYAALYYYDKSLTIYRIARMVVSDNRTASRMRHSEHYVMSCKLICLLYIGELDKAKTLLEHLDREGYSDKASEHARNVLSV